MQNTWMTLGLFLKNLDELDLLGWRVEKICFDNLMTRRKRNSHVASTVTCTMLDCKIYSSGNSRIDISKDGRFHPRLASPMLRENLQANVDLMSTVMRVTILFVLNSWELVSVLVLPCITTSEAHAIRWGYFR